MTDKQRDGTDEAPSRNDSTEDLNRGVPELDRERSRKIKDDEKAAHGTNQGPIDPDSAESDIDRDDTVTD